GGVERGVHRLVRVARSRMLDHRHLVAELGSEADGGLDTGMGEESDDDESMNAVILELQIQVSVGEATGAPVFERHDIARPRLELVADLAPPRPFGERLAL